MFITETEFYQTLYDNIDKIPLIKTNKSIGFYNVPAGFDIETSSFYYGDEKRAIMYEWSFGIAYKDGDNLVPLITYGRTWEEFSVFLYAISALLKTSQSRRLVVYVHNLPYEWQFMRKHFNWEKVFLLDDRKPVYAITDFGVEFRCSLKLSGKSLANTAKDLVKYKTEKKLGDLDYSLIRHPETPLTEAELGYCEHDVLVMLYYIQEKIESDGNITRIPLTKTGYVRRYVKKCCFPEEGEIFDVYEELEADAPGVPRVERNVRRRLYPRQSEVSWNDTSESWFIRLHEQLSSEYGSVQIPYGKR